MVPEVQPQAQKEIAKADEEIDQKNPFFQKYVDEEIRPYFLVMTQKYSFFQK